MTEKLFYNDSSCYTFTARTVNIDKDPESSLFKVELDRTCFYPEGGGQPADRGTINGIQVTDVQKEGETVFHYMKEAPGGESVTGEVNKDHRKEYVQQHTGQHILSALLKKLFNYNTLSVHQGEEYTSIEIDREFITENELMTLESEANRVVCSNLLIKTHVTADPEEYPLRRETKVTGTIRVVEITGLDYAACGGVHSRTTGEVGLIKVLFTEKIRGRVRIAFLIGERAYRDYGQKQKIVSALNTTLSVRDHEITERVTALLDQRENLKMQLSLQTKEMVSLYTEMLLSQEEKIITHLFQDKSADTLRKIADNLIKKRECTVLLLSESQRIQWIIASSDEQAVDFEQIKKQLLPLIDGRGGGRFPLWQGSGSKIDGVTDFIRSFVSLTDH